MVIELIVVVVLLTAGVAVGDLLKSAGPAIALTLAFLNPTVQELGRRKPKLTVQASEADRRGVVAAPALRPWPIDAERIVKNELAEARQTVDVGQTALDTFTALADPFAVRPSAADHERAKKAFDEQLADYETDMRTWLVDYQKACRERADTFQLAMRLENAASGAHADAITVVLDLPDGAGVADELPEMTTPPERPTYRPPRLRTFDVIDRLGNYGPLISPLSSIPRASAILPQAPETWTAVDDGRRLECTIGDVQAGRSLALGDPLLIRVARPGRHEVGWAIYSKSLRRATTGTLVLDLPADRDRPAFGRLHGILTFPDVPIVDEELDDDADEDGEEEVVFPDKRVARREVRSADPPEKPSSSEAADNTGDDVTRPAQGDSRLNSITRRLNDAAAWWEWQALGLDPAHDGPNRMEVGRAERVDQPPPR